MTNNKDTYETASEYAGRKATEIVGVVTQRNPDNVRIDEQNIRIIKRGEISSVFSLTLRYHDITGGEGKERVLIKYFPENNSRRSVNYKDFARGTIDTAELLSGNGDFPSFYSHHKIKGIGTFLVLEQLGEETFHDELKGVDPKDVAIAIQGILPYLSRFQINATRSLYEKIEESKIDASVYYSIFGKRDSSKRIIDYTRATLGNESIEDLNKDLVREVIDNTVPIQEIYSPRRDTFRVTHGDPISKNIISRNHGSNSYGFIDAEPTLGDCGLDLSAMLATPNLGLSSRDWIFLGQSFENTDARELDNSISLNSMREKLVDKLESIGVKFSNNEPPGNSAFYLFGGLFFRASRINAKVRDLQLKRPDLYDRMMADDPGLKTTADDMKRIMSVSLGKIVENPGKFGVSRPEYEQKLERLQDIMCNEGVLGSLKDYENGGGVIPENSKKNSTEVHS